MRLLVIFLTIYSCFVSASSKRSASTKSYSDADSQVRRDLLSPVRDENNFTFYLTTFPVEGLNPAIYRRDLNGALVMAGLTGCYGCLCYSMDHRYPVSGINIKLYTDEELSPIAKLMKIPENYQYISARANAFKSNHWESNVDGIMDMFNCDAATEQLLIEGHEKLQRVLVQNMGTHTSNYERYLKTKLADHESRVHFKNLEITEDLKKSNPEAVLQELKYRAKYVSDEIDRLKQAPFEQKKNWW